jgi:lysophospholipase L1-like esterase
MRKRYLHPSILIIFSFLILFSFELVLHLCDIRLKNAPFVTDLPIVPDFGKIDKKPPEHKNVFFIWDRYLLWKGRPNVIGQAHIGPRGVLGEMRFNSLGFRSPEISKIKNTDLKRIVCMGDSSTFGWIIYCEDAYPSILGNLLSSHLPNKYEVINVGIPGYSSFQGLIQLEKVVLDLKPDIISFLYGRNDSWYLKGQRDKENYEFNTSFMGRTRELLLHSKIYILLENIMFSLENKFQGNMQQKQIIRVPPEEFEINITKMIEIMSKSNIKPVIINHYWLLQGDSDFEMSPYNAILDSIGKKNDISTLNTKELFLRAYDKIKNDKGYLDAMKARFPEGRWDDQNYLHIFYADNCHPTQYGHYLIAVALARIIEHP